METGYVGTSLDDVARHMGATKGRIYHYFSSKADLLHAVRKHAMDINFAAIRPGFESDLPPVPRFQKMATAHALNMLEERAYQRALFDSLHLHVIGGNSTTDGAMMDDFIADRRAFEDMFRDVLQAGKQSGEFTFETMSFALHTILTLLNGTLSWYSPRPGETADDRQAIARELVEMSTRALGACELNDTKGNDL
ncbi:MAG: AcrR family transcriptional regulator [Paracoccaceae bacterium]|jgi:AcrR family transcriptional regulator